MGIGQTTLMQFTRRARVSRVSSLRNQDIEGDGLPAVHHSDAGARGESESGHLGSLRAEFGAYLANNKTNTAASFARRTSRPIN